ncbi:HD-GYP domain-containing protein [Ferrimonas sp.]|uniref:HD-GYP domain-containing protein n=1 Tax=Ferrimonas sp. TaxID=2080861 RepID=UPI003A8D942E
MLGQEQRMDGRSRLSVNLRQMVIAIETAASLVGLNDTQHGKRVAYISVQIGKQLGFSDHDLQFCFDLGLLHDCGVSTQKMHNKLVTKLFGSDAQSHCDTGYQLLRDFSPLSKYATPILYHHTPWQKLVQEDVSPHDALMANLIFLADRVDVLAATSAKNLILARREIVRELAKYIGEYFAPHIFKAFEKAQASEAFWISMEERHIASFVSRMEQFDMVRELSISDLKKLSLIMADIVDRKSHFTGNHSFLVAKLARFIAERYGLNEQQCEMIEIAGLLHDLGKLRIPDHILDKPGPLNSEERAIIQGHSFETYEILRQVEGLDEIATWAAFHHESLNGQGYPFHPYEQEYSVEARIIALADVYQAIVQDRPYRKGMTREEALSVVTQMASERKLDPQILEIVKNHQQSCFDLARGVGVSTVK